jgi:hypothetical protein
MHSNATTSNQGTRLTEDRATARARFTLTQSELLQLGMFRVGYMRAVTGDGGETEIVIHGADGRPVVHADSVEFAADAAGELGLALVAVH